MIRKSWGTKTQVPSNSDMLWVSMHPDRNRRPSSAREFTYRLPSNRDYTQGTTGASGGQQFGNHEDIAGIPEEEAAIGGHGIGAEFGDDLRLPAEGLKLAEGRRTLCAHGDGSLYSPR